MNLSARKAIRLLTEPYCNISPVKKHLENITPAQPTSTIFYEPQKAEVSIIVFDSKY
jgi:hypothetical protein